MIPPAHNTNQTVNFCGCNGVSRNSFGFGSTEKPETLNDLEANIERVIGDINPQILEKVSENWVSRIRHVRASRGGHTPEVIFKT